jgi:hypothetical protein
MPKPKPKVSEAASLRVLIRIARAASVAADHSLLRSAEIELAAYGVSLCDIGVVSATAADDSAKEVRP